MHTAIAAEITAVSKGVELGTVMANPSKGTHGVYSQGIKVGDENNEQVLDPRWARKYK